MATFEDIKKKAIETANTVVDVSTGYAKTAIEKAKVIGNIAKLNAELLQEKENARKGYAKIGQAYYELHKDSPETGMEDAIAAVNAANAAIEAKNAEIAALKASLTPAEATVEDAEETVAEATAEAEAVETETAAEEPAPEEAPAENAEAQEATEE